MEGIKDGDELGSALGDKLGVTEGTDDGPALGFDVGIKDGIAVGIKDGITLGFTLGSLLISSWYQIDIIPLGSDGPPIRRVLPLPLSPTLHPKLLFRL